MGVRSVLETKPTSDGISYLCSMGDMIEALSWLKIITQTYFNYHYAQCIPAKFTL